MTPLSERIKDFPAEQFVDWLCLACVDVREVRTPDAAQEEIDKIRSAVTERLSVLEQRAEAAEAKLAELEKQEPNTCDACVHVLASLGFNYRTAKLKDVLAEVKRIRPAPAVSLAELVPVAMRLKRRYICNEGRESEFIACVTPECSSIGTGGTWDDWRELSAILRNIEGNGTTKSAAPEVE
ncbi:hypothetical protein WKH08_09595 [Pantoea agglomerans]|uniref:hypothetical protein n=1 Tax=Enterobacter agglomerans TaxID=549 RepID=UPI003C7E0620